MRVHISADIEGVAGVVSAGQCQAGHPEYEKARILMIRRDQPRHSVAAGWRRDRDRRNRLARADDEPFARITAPAAEFILGKPKPMNMACGLTPSHDLFCMVGHHSRAGGTGILSHTTNSFAFREVRINGLPCGEPAIYGAYAAELDVPVGLISGDD